MFVCVTDGVVVGFVIGVFVGVIVGKLIEMFVPTKSGVSTESVVSVGVGDLVPVGSEVGASTIRGDVVRNGGAVSSGAAGAVRNGIGTTGNSYWSTASSPKTTK